jgi:Lipase
MAGFVGKKVKNGKVGTIVALDAAGPLYTNKSENSRLAKTDATYTECIHTNTDCYGILEPICQVNFYPNSGFDQPGCFRKISN